jgi:hypothetical protein
MAETLFHEKAKCIVCLGTKPCSYHAVRMGLTCGDCWSWEDIPEAVKRAYLCRRDNQPRKIKAVASKAARERVQKVYDPPRFYGEVKMDRPAPPSHPDAL